MVESGLRQTFLSQKNKLSGSEVNLLNFNAEDFWWHGIFYFLTIINKYPPKNKRWLNKRSDIRVKLSIEQYHSNTSIFI